MLIGCKQRIKGTRDRLMVRRLMSVPTVKEPVASDWLIGGGNSERTKIVSPERMWTGPAWMWRCGPVLSRCGLVLG